jgi:hypothetical protein
MGFSLAQAFHAWGDDGEIMDCQARFTGLLRLPKTRTPVNGRDMGMKIVRLFPRRKRLG